MNETLSHLAAVFATILLVFSFTTPVNAASKTPMPTNQTVPGDTPPPEPEEIQEDPQLLLAPPIITVWHESSLRFGQIGNPQTQINILGNVRDPDGQIASLTYELNENNNAIPLALGPNSTRLANAGDFNVAINTTALKSGTNILDFTATDNSNSTQTKRVTFAYTPGRVWPLPYSTNWAGANSIYDQAQIVDGLWDLVDGGVRPMQVGYDRLIAIGDTSWTNYEVVIPITTHMFYPNPNNLSDAGGVGIIARWTGHTGSASPPSNWSNLGAYAYYSNRLSALALRLDDSTVLEQGFDFQLNRTYMFKLRAETVENQAVYSFKIWEMGQPEPSWGSSQFSNIVNVTDATETRLNGSVLLVAHRVDATFGNATICPLNVTYPLSINTTGSGSVNAVPAKTNYQCGESVTLTATPDDGWTFVGWSGAITSNASSIHFNMTNAPITATFRQNSGGQVDQQIFLPVVSQE